MLYRRSTQLCLSFNKIGDAGASNLGKLLVTNRTLAEVCFHAPLRGAENDGKCVVQLELRKNMIGDEGTAELAKALATHCALTKVGCVPQRHAMVCMWWLRLDTWDFFPRSAQLNLSSNQIGELGAAKFAKALAVNRTLIMVFCALRIARELYPTYCCRLHCDCSSAGHGSRNGHIAACD